MKILKVLVILTMFSSMFLNAQNTELPLVICPESSEVPKLDGKLDDKCWQNASYITDFLNSYGNKFETQRNEMFLFRDRKNLYIGVKCHDDNIANIKKKFVKHDSNVFWDDCVELFISSGKYRSEYFHLLVNSLGTRLDILVNEFDQPSWNGKWRAVSYIGKDFWSVEIVIPFSDFGKTPNNGDTWGFNIAREVRHTNSRVEILAWSPTFQGSLLVPDRFGNIYFKKEKAPHLSLVNHDFSNNKVKLLIKSKKHLRLETVTTIGKEKAVFSETVAATELGKTLSMKLNYFPSWENFSFYLLAKDAKSGELLYQSPLYPLSKQPLSPRLTQIKKELNRLKADMIFLKKGVTGGKYIVTPVVPFKTILPNDLPDANAVNMPLSVESCLGEYQPASFRIFANEDLKNVKIILKDDLRCGNNVISKGNVDVRILKVWYQGGKGQKFEKKVLVPELLLKDDNIIEADEKTGRNVFSFKDIPVDGPKLKTFNIKAYTGKQIWLTVKVSSETKPGTYNGTITITSENSPETSVKLVLTIHPVKLRKPDRILGVYCYNDFAYFYGKTDADLKTDLRDMKEHGLNSAPVLYCNAGFKVTSSGKFETDLTDLDRLLAIYKEVGFDKPFILSFLQTKFFPKALFRMNLKPKADDASKFAFIVKQINAFIKNKKYPEAYFYGIDEPGYDYSGGPLKRCEEIFKIIKNSGGKTSTAINLWGFKKMGSMLDLPILDNVTAFRLYDNPEMKINQEKSLTYWHPVEAPLFDRLRFGIMLWKTNLRGVYPYAYRHVSQGHPYHDESQGPARKSNERNSMYTYPAKNGPIPTIQWEGVREGIDDLRYLQTLKYWVEVAEKNKDAGSELKTTIKEARLLLKLPPFFHQNFKEVDKNVKAEDFEKLRKKVIKNILEIKKILNQKKE